MDFTVMGGGHLFLKLAIIRILVKKNHVIRDVFRSRQCTRVRRLGVQKYAKFEKSVCFWS